MGVSLGAEAGDDAGIQEPESGPGVQSLWSSVSAVFHSAPWCPERPLQPSLPVSIREVCVRVHTDFPHNVSSTVIHSHVFSGHRAQVQGELVYGCVSGDGVVALDGWTIVSVSIIMYVPNPLQPLPWGLVDPAPVLTTTDGVTSSSAGEGEIL